MNFSSINNYASKACVTRWAFNKDYCDATDACSKIMINLCHDIKAHKQERETLNWCEKIVYHEELVNLRLAKVVAPLLILVNNNLGDDWCHLKHVNLMEQLRSYSNINSELTNKFNSGVLTGMQPIFKASDGDLQKLIDSSVVSLNEHTVVFENYNYNQSQSDPITHFMQGGQEDFKQSLMYWSTIIS